jgi:hypothetical protein
MDPKNSNVIVWTRKSFVGSLVSCRVGFQQNLGQKSVTDPSCQHNIWSHQQPQGHNKQESTTFILPYGSNKQHCMDKEELCWVFGVMQGWFSAKLGSKIIGWSQLSAQFCGATNSHRDITYRNQPLLFFHETWEFGPFLCPGDFSFSRRIFSACTNHHAKYVQFNGSCRRSMADFGQPPSTTIALQD